MNNNYSFEQRQLLRKIKKNKKERRNNRIKVIGMIVIVGLLFNAGIIIKGNIPRKCYIHSIDDNTLIVRHPKNDELYSLEVADASIYKEETMVTVVFDELTTENHWLPIDIKEEK